MEIYKLKNALDWVYNAAYNWHSWRTIPFTMFLGELFSHNLELFVKFWFGHHSNQSQMHGRLALIAVCPDETFLNTYWAVINKRVVDKVSSLRKVLRVRRVENKVVRLWGGTSCICLLPLISVPCLSCSFISIPLYWTNPTGAQKSDWWRCKISK